MSEYHNCQIIKGLDYDIYHNILTHVADDAMVLFLTGKFYSTLSQDLRSLQRGRGVESEDGSSVTLDKPVKAPHFAHGRMQKFTKKKSKRQRLEDEFSILSSSTNSLMRYNTDNEFDYVSSGRDSPAPRRMTIHPELNMELLKLHKEIEGLKGGLKFYTFRRCGLTL